jgi:cytochrome o ubiquinol oxidase subunit 1
MLGKLSWDAIPFDQPIPMTASVVVMVTLAGVMLFVVLKGWFPYVWRDWITSVDHKRIGVMYCVLALVMLLRGFTDAIMMRSQQALAFDAPGYLPPEHYDQIFSAHGTIMIFFVAMPFVIGLMYFVVPLQLGVRDVAFPTLNSVGFWLTASGASAVHWRRQWAGSKCLDDLFHSARVRWFFGVVAALVLRAIIVDRVRIATGQAFSTS